MMTIQYPWNNTAARIQSQSGPDGCCLSERRVPNLVITDTAVRTMKVIQVAKLSLALGVSAAIFGLLIILVISRFSRRKCFQK